MLSPMTRYWPVALWLLGAAGDGRHVSVAQAQVALPAVPGPGRWQLPAEDGALPSGAF